MLCSNRSPFQNPTQNARLLQLLGLPLVVVGEIENEGVILVLNNLVGLDAGVTLLFLPLVVVGEIENEGVILVLNNLVGLDAGVTLLFLPLEIGGIGETEVVPSNLVGLDAGVTLLFLSLGFVGEGNEILLNVINLKGKRDLFLLYLVKKETDLVHPSIQLINQL